MQKIKSGDKVAILAPCAQIGTIHKISAAVKYLENLGLIPVFGRNLLKIDRYMAGSDKQRADDINTAFADSEIKAIFCARAAAGGTRVLPHIDYELARRNPKPLIGFCDNAAVMLALWQKSGIISYNGFGLAYDFRTDSPLDLQIDADLKSLLSGKTYNIKSGQTLHCGKAQGELLCTNLSVLMRLAGTPYFPNLNGKILLLEDVHEKVYRIDLMLQQLKQQPDFNKLAGVIFGQFTDAESDAEDGSIDDCFADFLHNTDFPAIKDFNFGHTASRRVLPLGAKVKIDAEACLLEILSC
ncbi:MAG: LD-carboxypeptidase [Alphaproteobacteria bacterium]|nr:LD-carboxypeptidase [Alphaproteobacteria bacterium]